MDNVNKVPKISIGLPVYNGEGYLSDAINSVKNQTVENFELIISDNASDDRTEEICRHYAGGDRRIRYIRQAQNVGAAPNFNLLIDEARAPYFRWACHDDLLHPRAIEACIDVLDTRPDVVLAYPESQMIGSEGQPLEEAFFPIRKMHLLQDAPHERFEEYLWQYLNGGLCNPIYGVMRTGILARTARIQPYPASDLALLGELILAGKSFRIDERLFYRRYHEDMSTLANETDDELVAWFDPTAKTALTLTHWNYLLTLISAIRQWVTPFDEQRRCFALVWNILVKHKKRKLFNESIYAMKKIFQRVIAKPAIMINKQHRNHLDSVSADRAGSEPSKGVHADV